MKLNEYQQQAAASAIYPRDMKGVYPVLGLAGETGEVAEKVKKVIRDHGGHFSDEAKVEIAKELGDVLWYLAATAADLGFTLEEIAQLNLQKLASRTQRGTLQGSGDNR
ncbi:MAG: nucleoside triphosphate pyrophosphohydrolase family protein [Bacteroidales bacterium]|nr:nucleoside triphosphate pyrophosphohydrolase family protein [Bacteroidales bacterium]